LYSTPTETPKEGFSGNCFVPISDLNNSTYYFSSLNDIWGWATWRRAWLKFERTVPPHDELEVQNRIQKYFQNHEIEKWFARYLREAASNESQVWSTQWTLTLINNAGLTVVPQTNLVTNVGFDSDATHTSGDVFPLNHPCESLPSDYLLSERPNISFSCGYDILLERSLFRIRFRHRALRFYSGLMNKISHNSKKMGDLSVRLSKVVFPE
jgi:hypothetical protein